MHKILYFSGTGNTAFVAKHIEAILIEKGLEVSCDRIEAITPEECRDVESLYFGFPIFACDMPDFVSDFIQKMPSAKGTPVRLFSTMAFFSGKAMERAIDRFLKKDFSITPYYIRKMPGSDGLAFLKKEGRAAQKLLSNFNYDISDIRQWIDDDHILTNTRKVVDFGGKIVGSLMRAAEGGMKKKFRADENCISCRLCINICPVKNIHMENDKIKFEGKCILCMRCIHQCPVESIQIGKKTVNKFRYKGPGGKFSVK